MKEERLNFEDAWEEAIGIIHEEALAENELFDCTPGKED